MVVSYINSKLHQINQNYKNYSRAVLLNNPTNMGNEPCALKNHLIRILTTSSLSIHNQLNHIITTSASTIVTPTSTSSELTFDTWPTRLTLLDILSAVFIMYKFPKTSCAVVLAMCCMLLRIERAPFSDRPHFVFRVPNLSPTFIPVARMDDIIVEAGRRDGNLLPPMHQKTLRAVSIACKLGQGMHQVLGLQRGFKIAAYEPGNMSYPVWTMAQRTRKKTLSDLKDTLNHIVQRGSSSYIGLTSEEFNQTKMDLQANKDLEGLEWKVMVVNSNINNACSGPYNTIFLFTDLIDSCSDEELAVVIAHEIGHALARHSEEVWNPVKLIFTNVVWLIPFLPLAVKMQLQMDINNFQHRRKEFEADHIGMLLMASAGYDPRGAIMWLSKCASLQPDDVYYPTYTERVRYLKDPKRMKEAMSLYRDVRSLKLITNLIENWNSGSSFVQN